MFTMRPIGWVRSSRTELTDDNWDTVTAAIELAPDLPEACFQGLESFSHVEVLFVFHQADPGKTNLGLRRPRGNSAWPEVGIFAQRAKDRPNHLGSSMVRIEKRLGRTLHVKSLDAIDGTPVLDIKPVFAEFLPSEPITQPAWSHELMRNYWHAAGR